MKTSVACSITWSVEDMGRKLQRVSLASWMILIFLHCCSSCATPKALKSVLVGRQAAQAHHEAKKAKYLAGQTKTLGQKLKLSKGGVPMESIGVQRLRSEIKYLEAVEKTLKQSAKRELKIEKEIAKAAAKGKPLKGSTAKLIAKQEKQKLKAALAAQTAVAASAQSGLKASAQQSLKQVDNIVDSAKGASGSLANQLAQGASALGSAGGRSALDTVSDVAQTGAKVAKKSKKLKIFGREKKGISAAAAAAPVPIPVVPPVVIPPPAVVSNGLSDLSKVATEAADNVQKAAKKKKKSWWN